MEKKTSKGVFASKVVKSSSRFYKCDSAMATAMPYRERVKQGVGRDGRRKRRVPKACESCRIKKTKCDGELPCKRCEDNGYLCTSRIRRRIAYRQLPQGYAEFLENTQLMLISTIRKLYCMIRNSQAWELGEPSLNELGLPVIHDIVQKLGSLNPIKDICLPIHSMFFEDEAAMTELARQIGSFQHENREDSEDGIEDANSPNLRQNIQISGSEFDDFHFEGFQNAASSSANITDLLNQSLACCSNFEPAQSIAQMCHMANLPTEPMSMA